MPSFASSSKSLFLTFFLATLVSHGCERMPVSAVFARDDRCEWRLRRHWWRKLTVISHVRKPTRTMQSMLASCKTKELPPDNDRYVRLATLGEGEDVVADRSPALPPGSQCA